MPNLYTIVHAFALVGVVGSLIVGTVLLSDMRDREIARYALCIADVARAHHYPGDIYGREAWQLFAKECTH